MELGKLLTAISYEEYDQIPAMRAGLLKHMLKSPAHLKAAGESESQPTPSLRLGNLVHSMIERGPKFAELLIEEPVFVGKTKDGKDSTRSAEAKAKREAWRASLSPEQIVVSADEMARIMGMYRQISEHKLLRQIVEGATKESTLIVQCPETEVLLKCRPDLITSSGFLLDFKTSRDVSRRYVLRAMFSMDSYFYAFQLAFYVYCLRIAKISKQDGAHVAFIENEAPYGIKIYSLNEGDIDVGHQWVMQCLRRYKACTYHNEWPCYEERAEQLDIPQWAQSPNIPEEEYA